jgi:uncharacterized membrane protein (Fun14 family)
MQNYSNIYTIILCIQYERIMKTSAISPFAATIGGGFFGGVLLGYAIKKIVRIAAIMVGLFIVGLAFLQYQQIASINWDKFEVSITALATAITSTLNESNITTMTMSNIGIPLTGSMASGFTIGFLKG